MSLDIFTLHHNYTIGKEMVMKRTRVGGFFTILMGLVICYLLTTDLLFYFFDNVIETKTSIPVVVVNQNWGEISGDITFNVYLN